MAPSEQRFETYVSRIGSILGHADRVEPFKHYCTGLLLPVARKSVEPMAAHIAPQRVRSEHQRMHHFVADAPWSDAAMLGEVRNHVLTQVAQQAGLPEVLIVDDTGFPKKGRHSVGVARQYCGQLGKQDNCQVAVSVSVANEAFSLPVGWQLYLSESWANDADRRRKAKVPEDIEFATKPQIALRLIEQERIRRDSPRIVLADAAYGVDTAFREQLAAWGLQYVVGVTGAVSLWPPGEAPLAAPAWSGRGRPTKLLRRDASHKPVSAKTLAMELPRQRYRTVSWREGSNTALSGRFAAVRVRCAHRDRERTEPHPEQWFLIEWPREEMEPTKYFLSTLPASTPMRELVRLAKLRWRIERDYQDLKQEFGLGHFEGRSWRGFHHHASLCIATYGFLVAERVAQGKKNSAASGLRAQPALPESYHPRGSTGTASPARLDTHSPNAPDRSTDPTSASLPVLWEQA